MPLYFTSVVTPVWIVCLHLLLFASTMIQWWRGVNVIAPRRLLQALAIAFLIFFPFDALSISRSLITASVHLLFFIAMYQAVESQWVENATQRMLVIFLLFVTSLATSTHISIVVFVVLFTAVMFRQLILLSRRTSLADAGLPYSSTAIGPAGIGYVVPVLLIAIVLFPFLPRVRNPLVRGFLGGYESASTGISDTINFSEQRRIEPDPQVVARVWMPREVVAFFTPLRLRASVYDLYARDEWRSSVSRERELEREAEGRWRVGRPDGFSRQVEVQQALAQNRRLYLPVGATLVAGIPQIRYGPARGTYTYIGSTRTSSVTYSAALSRQSLPLFDRPLESTNYPVTEGIARLATTIAAGSTDPKVVSGRMERYLRREFRYLSDPSELGRPISIEEFLLEERRGHCEYFAAGMVAMLTSMNIPSRIVGGFYGGELNPLTGYFVVRLRDAHAWVEVYDGEKWQTFDPTPPDLRPGNVKANLFSLYAAAIGESVNYFWDRYVLTFGIGDQIALLADTFFAVRDRLQRLRRDGAFTFVSVARRMLIFAVLLGLVIALRAVVRYRRLTVYERFIELAERSGISVGVNLTASDIHDSIRRTRPALAEVVEPIFEHHYRERFSSGGSDPELHLAAERAFRAAQRVLSSSARVTPGPASTT